LSRPRFIDRRQFFILTAITVTGTTFLMLPREMAARSGTAGWLSVLLAGVGGLALAWTLIKLGTRFPELTPVQYAEQLLGKVLGKALGVVVVLASHYYLGVLLRQFAATFLIPFMPETPPVVFIGVMALLLAYGVYQGLTGIARTAQVFLPVIVVSLLFIFFGAVTQFKVGRLLPLLGSGPVSVKAPLAPFLPLPAVVKEGEAYRLVTDPAERPQSVGKLREFWGNFAMFVRAWALIREYGPEGLAQTAKLAVLNANYVRALLRGTYHLPYDTDSLHEVVFDDAQQKETGVTTMDVAKRLIDHGFHPPTIYFPLVVHGAIMIEPTETESRETLDRFVDAMKAIADEAKTDPEAVKAAPTRPVRARLDETRAARKPVLRWRPGMKVE
jgi:hypothetical protein